jgi:hypothetical protein
MAPPDGIDVVVRAHDPARLDELGRAVFSLVMQDHHPITVFVMLQRFDAAARDAVARTLAPIMAIAPDATLHVLNRPDPVPPDARAALLAQGLAAGNSRYAAVLDFDDLIYPEAYRLLIAELQDSGAALALGGILAATVDRDGVVPLVRAKAPLPPGAAWPLHRAVLDRQRIAPADLVAVDDDLLRRLTDRCAVSLRLQDTVIGERLVTEGAPGPGS